MIGKILKHKAYSSLYVKVVCNHKCDSNAYIIEIISLGKENVDIDYMGVSTVYDDYLDVNDMTNNNDTPFPGKVPVVLGKRYFIWLNYLNNNYNYVPFDMYGALFRILNVSED